MISQCALLVIYRYNWYYFIKYKDCLYSCCVDEVAAQHYNADAIIHYGRSCLSQPVKMPVLFVYGRQPLDIADCAHSFALLFPDESSNIIIMYDTVYAYACGKKSTYSICLYFS